MWRLNNVYPQLTTLIMGYCCVISIFSIYPIFFFGGRLFHFLQKKVHLVSKGANNVPEMNVTDHTLARRQFVRVQISITGYHDLPQGTSTSTASCLSIHCSLPFTRPLSTNECLYTGFNEWVCFLNRISSTCCRFLVPQRRNGSRIRSDWYSNVDRVWGCIVVDICWIFSSFFCGWFSGRNTCLGSLLVVAGIKCVLDKMSAGSVENHWAAQRLFSVLLLKLLIAIL